MLGKNILWSETGRCFSQHVKHFCMNGMPNPKSNNKNKTSEIEGIKRRLPCRKYSYICALDIHLNKEASSLK